MGRKFFVLMAVLAALLFTAPLAAQATPVDTQLMLVVDVSGSIDGTEYNLMMDGYADAFRSQLVKDAIDSREHQAIVVGLVFFASSAADSSVTWTEVTSATADTFADTLDDYARPPAYGGVGQMTNVAAGIDLAHSLGTATGYEPTRYIMDVSGDGVQNVAGNTAAERDQALGLYDAINGITIGGDTNLQTWYTNNVVGGETGFQTNADSFEDFGAAIQAKLAREIAITPEPGTLLLFGSAAGLLGFWRRRRARRV
jgi:hypothetical protein